MQLGYLRIDHLHYHINYPKTYSVCLDNSVTPLAHAPQFDGTARHSPDVPSLCNLTSVFLHTPFRDITPHVTAQSLTHRLPASSPRAVQYHTARYHPNVANHRLHASAHCKLARPYLYFIRSYQKISLLHIRNSNIQEPTSQHYCSTTSTLNNPLKNTSQNKQELLYT